VRQINRSRNSERGQVHGINTMIIQNTQGIGFAIPIQAVFDEFSITPP
jgi:S1-C subfamily serine protease